MSQTVIYVSCAQSREILVYHLDAARGEVRKIQSLPLPGGAQPLGVSPDRRVLYTGLRPDNTLVALGIDPHDGKLSRLGSSQVEGGPTYVSTDRAGRMVFSASWGGNTLCVCPLDERGVPGPMIQCENGIEHAHAALADAGNRWLLVPALGEDAIRIYRIGETGLTAYTTVSVRAGSGPRHPVFSPDGRHVWCLNELDGTIDMFDFDADAGGLAMRQSVNMLPPGFNGKPWAAELRATPDGCFLYATDRTASEIAAFAVEPETARLELVGHFPTEIQPRSLAIDPSGRWLAATGQLSHHLTLYAIDPQSGRLEARQRVEAGQDPIMVEMVGLPG